MGAPPAGARCTIQVQLHVFVLHTIYSRHPPCLRDPLLAAHVGGYPTLFVQCAEVTVSNTLVLNSSTFASIIQKSFSPATTQLSTLLWWATPANAADLCPQYTNAANEAINGTLNSNGTFVQLDAFNAGAFSVAGTSCSKWPCDVNAPFGGAYSIVSELASAPRISFLPTGCTGASCVAPFYNTPFPGCPNGVVAASVATKVWSSSPCAVTANGHPPSFYGPDPTQPLVVGNVTSPPPPSPPPSPPSPPPPSSPFPVSQKGIVAWLAVITAVFSLSFVVICCAALSRVIVIAPPTADSNAEGKTSNHLAGSAV